MTSTVVLAAALLISSLLMTTHDHPDGLPETECMVCTVGFEELQAATSAAGRVPILHGQSQSLFSTASGYGLFSTTAFSPRAPPLF